MSGEKGAYSHILDMEMWFAVFSSVLTGSGLSQPVQTALQRSLSHSRTLTLLTSYSLILTLFLSSTLCHTHTLPLFTISQTLSLSLSLSHSHTHSRTHSHSHSHSHSQLWDLSAGRLLADFKDHTSAVTSVLFHPRELLLATGSADRTAMLWDLETFEALSVCGPEATAVRKIQFHPDGSVLFTTALNSLRVRDSVQTLSSSKHLCCIVYSIANLSVCYI